MHRITEDMKQWSAMLENELRSWPHVTTRPMFGLLPVTRAIGAPNSIIFKFKSIPPDLSQRVNRDSRVSIGTKMRAKGWLSFEINSSEDLRDALLWLGEAYELAT
jgi:hypothetical protein